MATPLILRQIRFQSLRAFKHKSMQLSDTSQINKLRKDKAKILTVLNERKILKRIEQEEKDNENE